MYGLEATVDMDAKERIGLTMKAQQEFGVGAPPVAAQSRGLAGASLGKAIAKHALTIAGEPLCSPLQDSKRKSRAMERGTGKQGRKESALPEKEISIGGDRNENPGKHLPASDGSRYAIRSARKS